MTPLTDSLENTDISLVIGQIWPGRIWKKEREHKVGKSWEEVEVRETENHGHREQGAWESRKRKKASSKQELKSRMKQNNGHKFEGF